MSLETIEDLAIDTRSWGRWEVERLFEWIDGYLRGGARKMPGKILITWEQRPYLIQMIDRFGQPRVELRQMVDVGNPHPDAPVSYVELLHTPFRDMRVEVVGYRVEHEA